MLCACIPFYDCARIAMFTLAGHLVHWFGITEKDWHRIKLNIDSKCRTAFRRKMRGQSLSVKAFRGRTQSTLINVAHSSKVDSEDDSSLPPGDAVLRINEVLAVALRQSLNL